MAFSNEQDEKTFIEVYKNFKDGNLNASAELLNTIPESSNLVGKKYYLLGVINNRLGDFDQSIKSFKKSISLKHRPYDIWYEYGQALFAVNELEKSRKSFMRSYNRKYKRDEALYYMGHISQILEQHKLAYRYFVKIIKNRKSNKQNKQIAHLQMAESMHNFIQKQKNPRKVVIKYILPLLKRGIKIDPKSGIAKDCEKRIKELWQQYDLDPNVMKNGRRLPKKRLTAFIEQDFTYDNNNTDSSEDSASSTLKDSTSIYKTTASIQKKYSFKRRFVLTPRMKFVYTEHSNQDNSLIFTNDSYSFNPKLQFSYEHKLFNQPASALMNMDYTYKAQDHSKTHNREYYSKTYNYSLGEKFHFFKPGETTMKYIYKENRNRDATLHTTTHSLQLTQIMVNKTGSLFIYLFQGDIIDNFNSVNDSTNVYLNRLDFIKPNFFLSSTLSLGFSVTLTDTKEQDATRGLEKTYSPSLGMAWKFKKKWKVNLHASYSKKDSKDTVDQIYKKYDAGISLRYSY
jgi:tetratricopeptide (TPR) repeat protein